MADRQYIDGVPQSTSRLQSSSRLQSTVAARPRVPRISNSWFLSFALYNGHRTARYYTFLGGRCRYESVGIYALLLFSLVFHLFCVVVDDEAIQAFQRGCNDDTLDAANALFCRFFDISLDAFTYRTIIAAAVAIQLQRLLPGLSPAPRPYTQHFPRADALIIVLGQTTRLPRIGSQKVSKRGGAWWCGSHLGTTGSEFQPSAQTSEQLQAVRQFQKCLAVCLASFLDPPR